MKSGDDAKFAEEMGDLLVTSCISFANRGEQGRFTVDRRDSRGAREDGATAPARLWEKRARDAAEVLRNWEQIKAQERQGAQEGQGNGGAKNEEKPKSLLDGVPRTLPATMEGFAIDAQGRARRF